MYKIEKVTEWSIDFIDLINSMNFPIWGECFQDYYLLEKKWQLTNSEFYIISEGDKVVSFFPVIPRTTNNVIQKRLYFFEDYSFPFTFVGRQIPLSEFGFKEVPHRTDLANSKGSNKLLLEDLLKNRNLKNAYKYLLDPAITTVRSKFDIRKMGYLTYDWAKYSTEVLNVKNSEYSDSIPWDNKYHYINFFTNLEEIGLLRVYESYYKNSLMAIGYYYMRTPNELYWLFTIRRQSKIPFGHIVTLKALQEEENANILNLGVDYASPDNKIKNYNGIPFNTIMGLETI